MRRLALMRSWCSCARVCLRRGIISPRPSSGSVVGGRIVTSPVGVADREEQAAAGLRGVGAPRRGRPDHHAVGYQARTQVGQTGITAVMAFIAYAPGKTQVSC